MLGCCPRKRVRAMENHPSSCHSCPTTLGEIHRHLERQASRRAGYWARDNNAVKKMRMIAAAVALLHYPSPRLRVQKVPSDSLNLKFDG